MMLTGEPRHFNQLAITLKPAVARRTLARRLKELEAAELVKRIIVPGRPLGTVYCLSDKGKCALESLLQLESRLECFRS